MRKRTGSSVIRLSCFQDLGGPNSITENPFNIRRHQTRRPPPTSQRQRRRPLETPPIPLTTLPPNQEWTAQSLPHIGPRSNTCSRVTGCSTERTRSWACSHQGVNRGGISNANNLNFISNSERKHPAQYESCIFNCRFNVIGQLNSVDVTQTAVSILPTQCFQSQLSN